MEFGKWCARWEDFLNERTTLISGKTTYTHRRLRTAKRSLRTHLKWLFTYEEHTEVNIPNTTNMLEGYNSQLKRALLNHNGLSDTNKKKFIDGFLNITKQAGNCQPTICPLQTSGAFSAYQMSITPIFGRSLKTSLPIWEKFNNVLIILHTSIQCLPFTFQKLTF